MPLFENSFSLAFYCTYPN